MGHHRKTIPAATELLVFDRSRRRCALCFYISGDLTEKHGQIAHLDQDSSNSVEDNLAFLCLPHHSVYDSKTRQHKNYTLVEVKKARNDLYAAIEQNRHPAAPILRTEGRNADRKTLADLINALQEAIFFLRGFSFRGTSFPIFKLDPISNFLRMCREPVNEFVDADLEADRRAMIDRLNRLDRLVFRVCDLVPGQSGWYRVPIEWLDTRPADYDKSATRLDNAGRQVCAQFDNLVRNARKRLDQ
jgi:hypothetical protein